MTPVIASSTGTPAATSAPKREHEDHERDGQREESAPCHVVGPRLVKGLLDAAAADLLDAQVRMRALGGGRRLEAGVHLLLGQLRIALEVERDHGGPAVLGDLAEVARPIGRADVLHRAGLLQARRHVGDGGLEGRIARRPALDEDLLAGRLLEVLGQDLLGAAATPRCRSRRRSSPSCRRLPPTTHGENDEDEPSDDGRLTMPGAPHTGARGEVAAFHDCSSVAMCLRHEDKVPPGARPICGACWRLGVRNSSPRRAGIRTTAPALCGLTARGGVGTRMGDSPRVGENHLMTRTVLIVDDHPSFRGSARRLFEADGYDVVGEAEDGSSARAGRG